MNQIETSPNQVIEKNLITFRAFLKSLKNPVHISDHEVLIGSNVIYYQHTKMLRFTAAVVLIHCGPDEGSIQIVQRDFEGIDMDMSLSIAEAIYSPGRSVNVLSIGNISAKTALIDLEENAMLMKGLN